MKQTKLFNNMQKLFENWRGYLNEADPPAQDAGQEMINRIADWRGIPRREARPGKEIAADIGYNRDPDSDADDAAELHNIAPEINRALIEKTIEDFSFNSAQSSQHRWSPRQPIIDYYFDKRIGGWKFQAAIPDGTNDAAKWPRVPKDGTWSDESVEDFLAFVQETPHQFNLGLKQHEKLFENWRRYQKRNLKEISGAGGKHEERVLDSVASAGQDSLSGLKDRVYRDIWKYSGKRACSWWGPCNSRMITTNSRHNLPFDSHKHILAAALYTSKYGKTITGLAGWLREKWQSLDGGIPDPMDLANNEIGVSIGEKYSNFEREFIDTVIYKEIKSGNFYVRDGKTMWKDAAPEQKR